MRNLTKELKRMPYRRLLAAVLATNSIVVISIFLALKKLPPVVPLFWGKPTGDAQLAGTWYLFTLPGLALILTGINTTLLAFGTKNTLSARVLASTSVIVTILSTIAVYRIMFLVGNII